MTPAGMQDHHLLVLSATGALVDKVTPGDLALPTPCGAWDLADLLSHMIGQQVGFATAVERGDAPAGAYAGPPIAPETLGPLWDESAARLTRAFEDADPASQVTLAEVGLTLDVDTALQVHLLDAVVHCWDVAVALRSSYRPDDDVAAFSLGFARAIAKPEGVPPFFGASLAEQHEDAWADTLRLLGRDPAAWEAGRRRL